MNGPTTRHRSAPKKKPKPPSINGNSPNSVVTKHKDSSDMKKSSSSSAKNFCSCLGNAHFLKWRANDIWGVVRHHPIPCVFAASLLFFMAVEYTLRMIPPTAPPFDLGFIATTNLHRLLESRPTLNTILAGLNTVFVGMQTTYILWTWLMEGRPRATISALFMFTCRGILGYVTQLPLPEGFLGSGADFPVGNVSFFLFYSGHVAASIIASLDMKRMKRWELSYIFDILNVLQVIRLLSTRGHYTIDLAVGIGAGILFDSLAGKYEDSKKREALLVSSATTYGSIYNTQKERNGELGFLGSGADFPVGNVSFFLFYSGHVAALIIASLDMKRMKRWELSYIFDILNVVQVIRLLSTRGHYTIDLAVGIGAGILFDSLAGKYEDSKKREALLVSSATTYGSIYNTQKERNGELVG